MNLVEKNIVTIQALCQKHKVGHLFVFGSILTNRFNKSSDIDFIVDFQDVDLYDYADNYFDFKESLEHLLNRPVDLLEDKAVKNPYLRKSIDSSKQLIYG
jgi:predicted nucleotidyltransferase